MRRTIQRPGVLGILALTLAACDPPASPPPAPQWGDVAVDVRLDDEPATCAQIGASEVAIDARSGSDDWDETVVSFPCTDMTALTARVFGAERAMLFDGPGRFRSDRASLLHQVVDDEVTFRFGTLTADFVPGEVSGCGPVARLALTARLPLIDGADPLTLERSAACGQPIVLPEHPDVELRELLGWVDVGGGDFRACYRLLEPVVVSTDGDPDPVPVPFNPAPADAAACEPFASPPQNCGELETPEGALALPDGACPKDEAQPCDGYENSINFTGFSANQTLIDLSKLLGVCVNMEHSWMRDLVIYAECPNGTRVMLSDFAGHSGGQVFLGEPNDLDEGAPMPGTGWDYCWTPNATNLPWIPYANANLPGTLPSGDYQSSQPLSAFVGCPLNGDWKIRVEDRWGIDNGFIFRWSVMFDPSIVEDCESWPN